MIADAERKADRGAGLERGVDQPRRRALGTSGRRRSTHVEQDRRALAIDADHVQMQARENAIAVGLRQPIGPGIATQKARLLAVEEDDAQRASQRRARELLHHAEHHGATAGVVGGAGAVRHGVVVRRDDDLAQLGIGAGHHALDVARAVGHEVDSDLLDAETRQTIGQQRARVVVRGGGRQPRTQIGDLVDQRHRRLERSVDRLRPARRGDEGQSERGGGVPQADGAGRAATQRRDGAVHRSSSGCETRRRGRGGDSPLARSSQPLQASTLGAAILEVETECARAIRLDATPALGQDATRYRRPAAIAVVHHRHRDLDQPLQQLLGLRRRRAPHFLPHLVRLEKALGIEMVDPLDQETPPLLRREVGVEGGGAHHASGTRISRFRIASAFPTVTCD